MEKGANVNAIINDKSNAILGAAIFTQNNLELARYLLEQGAEVDVTGYMNRTMLHFCSLISRLEMLKLLLEFKADVEARDEEGATALHLAVQQDGLRGIRVAGVGRGGEGGGVQILRQRVPQWS